MLERVTLSDPRQWNFVPSPRPGPARRVRLLSIAEQNLRSGSGAFRGIADDNGRWWIKPLNNSQDPRVPITEWIISQVGDLIHAPVCETTIVEIPSELEGEEFLPGTELKQGLAFGSRHIDDIVEERDLVHRREDDNRARHAGVYALYDWCWGGDDQWLYQASDENRLFSHDHGSYLPGGPYWTTLRLSEAVNEAHLPSHPAEGVDTKALLAYAGRLDTLSSLALGATLGTVPEEWPVSQVELNTVGWFLMRRAPEVSKRLRELAETNSEGLAK